MKTLKKFIIVILSTLMFFCVLLFSGCFLFNKSKQEQEPSEKLITTLCDSSKILDYYASGSTIYTSPQGSITMVLGNERNGTGFIWNLSDCDFEVATEYTIRITNLYITGFSTQTPTNAALELYWQDSAYSFLKYLNTKTNYFGSDINYPNNYLFLSEHRYNTYEIKFKFNHTAIDTVTYKNLYFNFTGVEYNGMVSLDKISIYKIN